MSIWITLILVIVSDKVISHSFGPMRDFDVYGNEITFDPPSTTDNGEFIPFESEKSFSTSATEETHEDGTLQDRDTRNTTEFHTTTEATGIDENGCDMGMRRKYEKKCETSYDTISERNEEIRNDEERKEARCCSMEDYEKCVLQALDRSNCGHHKAALRSDLQATRLLMNVISNTTCTEYRGKCGSYPSAANPTAATIGVVLTLLTAVLF